MTQQVTTQEVDGTRHRPFASHLNPWAESQAVQSQFESRTFETEGNFCLTLFKKGMVVLDAGCGPGSITIGLAEVVRPGSVTALDGDAAMLARVATLCDASFPPVRLSHSDLSQRLPFGDATFDAVWAHAVLYHLGDPIETLREFRRILKPGGFVAIRDSFSPADVIWPNTPLIRRAFEISEKLVRSNGGNPEFGASQRNALHLADFEKIRSGATFENLSASDTGLRDYANQHQEYLNEPAVREKLIRCGLATEDEIEDVAAAVLEWATNPGGVFMRCRCHAVGFKAKHEKIDSAGICD